MLAGVATLVAIAACGPVASTPEASAPQPTVTAAERADTFDVVWGGDVLLGDAAAPILAERGFAWPFDRIVDLLAGDYLVVNVEGPITRISEPYFADQEFSYNADPAEAAALAEVGVDAGGLSNNHALDRGPEGLRDTIEHLDDAGVSPFGAGTEAEAIAPLLVETPHGTLAVVGLGERWTYGAEASAETLGTVSITAESIRRAHDLAIEAGARWVVAFVHWGENYSAVTEEQRAAARRFADTGYDLVIGHHAHVPQEVDVIGEMPVLYSLGNLVFGTPGRFEAGEGFGLIATTRLAADGGMTVELACIVTDNDAVGFQPEPCVRAEAEGVFAELGPRIQVQADRAIVRAP
jgi:hypothetical protein